MNTYFDEKKTEMGLISGLRMQDGLPNKLMNMNSGHQQLGRKKIIHGDFENVSKIRTRKMRTLIHTLNSSLLLQMHQVWNPIS